MTSTDVSITSPFQSKTQNNEIFRVKITAGSLSPYNKGRDTKVRTPSSVKNLFVSY